MKRASLLFAVAALTVGCGASTEAMGPKPTGGLTTKGGEGTLDGSKPAPDDERKPGNGEQVATPDVAATAAPNASDPMKESRLSDGLFKKNDADAKPEEKQVAHARKATIKAATTASMSGQFTPEQLELSVSDNIDAFSHCSDSDVTVSLRALIAGTGKVMNASAQRSVPDDARMRDCVVDAFKGIQFPANHDGKSAPITFDLVLSAPS